MYKDKFSISVDIMTADIIKIMSKYDLDEDKAMALSHKSELYKILEKEETKVWQDSFKMIVELFDREMNGKLKFPEV